MRAIQQTYKAVKQVLGERKYVFILFSFALFFFALFVFIPVATIPGNNIRFQLSIFRPQDYLFMILLALLVGLNFSMNIYAWKKSKQSANISQSAASGATAGLRLAGVASATQAGLRRSVRGNCGNCHLRIVPRFFIWHCRTWNRQCCLCFEVPDIIPSWSYSACGYFSLLYRAES